jgi:hypothetical protein
MPSQTPPHSPTDGARCRGCQGRRSHRQREACEQVYTGVGERAGKKRLLQLLYPQIREFLVCVDVGDVSLTWHPGPALHPLGKPHEKPPRVLSVPLLGPLFDATTPPSPRSPPAASPPLHLHRGKHELGPFRTPCAQSQALQFDEKVGGAAAGKEAGKKGKKKPSVRNPTLTALASAPPCSPCRGNERECPLRLQCPLRGLNS